MMKKMLSLFLIMTLMFGIIGAGAVFADDEIKNDPDPLEGEEMIAEACIGDAEYASLIDAVQAAESDDTVTLLKDVELTQVLEICTPLTLDLNGYTICGDGTRSLLWLESNVTITDGSEAGTGRLTNGGGKNGCIVVYRCTLTLNGGTITGNTASSAGGGVYVWIGKLIVDGGTITGNTADKGAGVYLVGQSALDLISGNIYNNAAASAGDDIYAAEKSAVALSDAANAGISVGGFDISGWFLDNADARWGQDYAAVPFSGEKEGIAVGLKAAHDRFFTVTFNTNEGNDSVIEARGVLSGEKIAQPGNPTRSGYSFGGWFSDEALTTPYDFNAPVTENITLYAQWNVIYIPSAGNVTDNTTNLEDEDVPLADLPMMFTDVAETDWFYDAVKYCFDSALMSGVSDTEFDPHGVANRQQIITMLYRTAVKAGADVSIGESTNILSYSDVSTVAEWAIPAMQWACGIGLVKGDDAGRLGATDAITREQLAVMLYRYEQLVNNGGFTGAWMFQLDFADADQISSWADEAMHWVVMKNIMGGKGDGILDPQGNAQRCEVAAMLMRFIEK